MKHINKYISTIVVVSVVVLGGFLFAGQRSAWAAPNSAGNNPQIVANYSSGDHGIVGEPFLHQGSDVVMQAGSSGNFQQWFYGTSTESTGTHGDHSIWMLANNGTCPNSNWILVPNASASWGDYLVAGADYCVKTNDYQVKP